MSYYYLKIWKLVLWPLLDVLKEVIFWEEVGSSCFIIGLQNGLSNMVILLLQEPLKRFCVIFYSVLRHDGRIKYVINIKWNVNLDAQLIKVLWSEIECKFLIVLRISSPSPCYIWSVKPLLWWTPHYTPVHKHDWYLIYHQNNQWQNQNSKLSIDSFK